MSTKGGMITDMSAELEKEFGWKNRGTLLQHLSRTKSVICQFR